MPATRWDTARRCGANTRSAASCSNTAAGGALPGPACCGAPIISAAGKPGRPGQPLSRLRDAEGRQDDPRSQASTEIHVARRDARIFIGHIRARTGRYPVLYQPRGRHAILAAYRNDYPVLARLPIWYARYKPDVRAYSRWATLGQLPALAVLRRRQLQQAALPYRVPNTLPDIDVNVAAMNKADLAKIWAGGDASAGAQADPPACRKDRGWSRASPLPPPVAQHRACRRSRNCPSPGLGDSRRAGRDRHLLGAAARRSTP